MDGHDITLRGGLVVHIREMRLADEAELVQGFERLSQETRYMRFMRVVQQPDLKRLRAVLSSFPEAGVGVVATIPAADGIDIVGSAIAVFDTDQTRCEFATTVAASFSGVGLATALMKALIDESVRRGVKEMEGFVLAENHRMLRLAKRLGFSITPEPGDATVRICRMTLGAPQPDATASKLPQ